MPGTMILNAAELTALPTAGAAWNRVVATSLADAGTPNLANIDSIVQTKVLIQAMRYAKDGGGVGRTAIINKIKAVCGTESSTSQPLNPYRQVATWLAAANLVDMPGSTLVSVNGTNMSFDAWVRSLPDKVLPGQTNWNTIRKCARTAGNNWGAYARPALLAIGLWLNDAAIIAEARNYFKRFLGDLSVPNTFTPSGAFSSGWDGPSTTYPTGQGVINPVSSNKDLNGANSEDASRGSSAPPLTGSGSSYTMEAIDGALFTALLLHHHGDTSVWQWSDSALKRNAVSVDATNANWSGANHIYWGLTHLVNHVYGTSLPEKVPDSYGSRATPYCMDWMAEGNYLRVGDNGGGNPPADVPPDVEATISVAGSVATLDASGTAAKTNPIARIDVEWGDTLRDSIAGSGRTATHTYAQPGVYTATITAVDTKGLTDTMQVQVSVSQDRAPIADFFLSKLTGPAPLTTILDSTASRDPDNTAITRFVDWDDTTNTPNAGAVVSHTFNLPGTYSVRLDVTSNGTTTSKVATVTVTDPAEQAPTFLFTLVGGQVVPVLPAYDSAWNGWHMYMGNFRLWVDGAGVLRFKNGAPTSDTDGTALGGTSTFDPATVEGLAFYNGAWPARPAGFARVRWIGGTTRPTGMATNDVWERAA